jgi:hypothetical protein
MSLAMEFIVVPYLRDNFFIISFEIFLAQAIGFNFIKEITHSRFQNLLSSIGNIG